MTDTESKKVKKKTYPTSYPTTIYCDWMSSMLWFVLKFIMLHLNLQLLHWALVSLEFHQVWTLNHSELCQGQFCLKLRFMFLGFTCKGKWTDHSNNTWGSSDSSFWIDGDLSTFARDKGNDCLHNVTNTAKTLWSSSKRFLNTVEDIQWGHNSQ